MTERYSGDFNECTSISELTEDLSDASPLGSGATTDEMPKTGEQKPARSFTARREVFSSAEEMKLAVTVAARSAASAFRDACESRSEDEGESRFVAAKEALKELWQFARMKSRAFQDLVGLIDAAVGHAQLSDFDQTQRDVLRIAFLDLQRWFIEEEAVQECIKRFAECGIDILGPVRVVPATRKYRVSIEETA